MSDFNNVLNTAAKSNYDAIIVGGEETAAFAAIAARRQGVDCVLIAPRNRVGGMTTGGMSFPDFVPNKSPYAVATVAKEFFGRIARRYSPNGGNSFRQFHKAGGGYRPRWARKILKEMLREAGVTVIYNKPIQSVTKVGTKITSAVLGADTYTAAYWVEGTACGDVVRLAGLSRSTGRESNAQNNETGGGVLAPQSFDANNSVIDPYVIPGVASSGLIVGVDPGVNGDGSAPETVGSGDGRVMGFGVRLFLTSVAGEKISWATLFGGVPPTGFLASNYEMFGRMFAASPSFYGDATLGLSRFLTFYDLFSTPSGSQMGPTYYQYVDCNSSGAISTDYPDQATCLEYVTATDSRRLEIEALAKQWILGLFYWLLYSGDSRIPSVLITALSAYGFSTLEFTENGGWSPNFYAREGTRVIGDFVLTKPNAVLQNGYTDVVAFGYYQFDTKPVRRVVVGGAVKLEGVNTETPAASEFCYGIPYRCLLPKASECTNLLVPGAPSISQHAERSARAIPTTMMLGHAAGIALAHAVRDQVAVQAVDVSMLLQDIDLYERFNGVVTATGGGGGTVTLTGTTTSVSNRFPFVVGGFRSIAAATNAQVRFQPNIARTSAFAVYVMYPPDIAGARASNAKVNVSSLGVVSTLTLNQQYDTSVAGGGGWWECVGVFTFRQGVPSTDYIEFDNTSGDGVLTISAVKFVAIDPAY